VQGQVEAVLGEKSIMRSLIVGEFEEYVAVGKSHCVRKMV
jgi:hypothetical protein